MSNGNQTKDYKLTIDFAKHLCMLSRSEKGKQARNYFIEIEKRFNAGQVPQILPQGQELLALAILEAQKIIEEKNTLSGVRQ